MTHDSHRCLFMKLMKKFAGLILTPGILFTLSCHEATGAIIAQYATPTSTNGQLNVAGPTPGLAVSNLSSVGLTVTTAAISSRAPNAGTAYPAGVNDTDYFLMVDSNSVGSSNSSTTDYFKLTISNSGTETVQLNSFTFDSVVQGTGSAQSGVYVLYYSTNAFASSNTATLSPGTNTTNSGFSDVVSMSADLSSLSIAAGETMEFRLSLNGTSGLNTKRHMFENITVSAVPEPASALLASLGILFALRRRR